MTFQQLLQGAEVLSQSGNPAVAGVEYDSRRVRPGTVFVAMKGETSDGNRFIDYVGSFGPAILGHAHPIVVQSVGEQTQAEEVERRAVDHNLAERIGLQEGRRSHVSPQWPE